MGRLFGEGTGIRDLKELESCCLLGEPGLECEGEYPRAPIMGRGMAMGLGGPLFLAPGVFGIAGDCLCSCWCCCWDDVDREGDAMPVDSI